MPAFCSYCNCSGTEVTCEKCRSETQVLIEEFDIAYRKWLDEGDEHE